GPAQKIFMPLALPVPLRRSSCRWRFRSGLEDLHVDGEVLLGVGADHGHKLVAVGEELVEVVVERVVGGQLAGGAFAGGEAGGERVEARGGVLEVVVDGVVGEELTGGA